MSPIPKPPKPKTPIQQAIEAITLAQAKGMAMPTTVQLSEDGMAQLRDLIATPTAVIAHPGSTLMGIPIEYKGKRLNAVSFDEAHSHEKSELERQLEESLWARATLHTPCFTRIELSRHVGTGHMEGDWYVRRLYENEVQLLCTCQMILVMARCLHNDAQGPCEEPAFPVEGTLKRDVRCSQHGGKG